MGVVERIPGGREGELRLRVHLEAPEWTVVRRLPEQLREVLLDPERSPKVIDRLFPITHAHDPEAEAEHRRLLGQSLFDQRLEVLRAFEKSCDQAEPRGKGCVVELDEPRLDLWLHVINDVRLMLATELNIQDNLWFDEQMLDASQGASYFQLMILSALQEMLLRAAGAG